MDEGLYDVALSTALDAYKRGYLKKARRLIDELLSKELSDVQRLSALNEKRNLVVRGGWQRAGLGKRDAQAKRELKDVDDQRHRLLKALSD